MQIEIKETEPCKLSVHYEADAEQILNKRSEIINAFKKAPVPGFRPGKASMDAIKFHYKNQIEDSLKRALAEDAYHNTLFEKKIKPHGAPFFNSAFLVSNKFTCDFDLHTKPEFELPNYLGLEIPKPHQAMTVLEATEKMLQELRVRFGETTPFSESDFVQKGDNLIIDYEGTINGENIENLSAQGEMLTVGHSRVHEFDDNLLGMTIGETRSFSVTVAENGMPSLAGKTVNFTVTLNVGSKHVPAALDDELAKKMGKNTLQELRELVTASAVVQLENSNKKLVNNVISNKLVDNVKLDVPAWMSLSEAKYLAHHSKIDWDTLKDEDRQQYISMAERNVKLALILDKIRENEPEAQLSDQEVFDMVKDNLSKTQVKTSLDDIIKEMNRTGYLQILFSRIRDEYTLDFVVKNAKVIE